MDKKIKKPLKKSNLSFLYFFNKKDAESKYLAGFVRDKLILINYNNYFNFHFVDADSLKFKMNEFCRSEKFKNTNIIFIEQAYTDLIENENLVGKEINILDRESFEVAERLAGTSNSFYDNVFCKIKEYINDYYGKIKCFKISNISKCKISVTENVEATCAMIMENRYFTENNKDDFKRICKNNIKKSIDTEELNMERLEMALKDSRKKLKMLKDRFNQIDSEIDEL